MKNQELARIFRHVALYLEMDNDIILKKRSFLKFSKSKGFRNLGETEFLRRSRRSEASPKIFRIRAYENAANSLESLPDDIENIYKKGGIKALEDVQGVGRGIAEKIEEYLKTGKIKHYEEMKKRVPVDIDSLSAVEGLGPKKILILYKKLKIKNLKDLENSAQAGKIRKLAGFGAKTEENILKGIGFAKTSNERFPIGVVLPIAVEIEKRLQSLPYVKRAIVAGSIRRRKETIGDADFLVVSEQPRKVMDYFVSMPDIARVYGRGETKSMIKLKNGLDADLRVVPERSLGAALNYFTGSKEHNVALRTIAIKKGMKLNEYGLFRGPKFTAGKDEEGLYKALGLHYIEPEIRENTGEIEASRKNILPDLISCDDLKGDLQVQTTWTDGANSIEEMALAAKHHGLSYIVITDHTKSLAVTGGLDEKRLVQQSKEIDKLNDRLDGITVLKGAEVNIMKDGSLDIDNSALRELDVVGFAVHSLFKMPKKEMTERIIKAMNNGHADILFHPTGREIGKRPPFDISIEKMIDAAKETGTVLEIDAYPSRLDLKDEHIRLAIKNGVKLSIDSDAHNANHFRFLEFGIAQARRGWAEKKDIINAWPLDKMKKMLK